MNFKEYIPAIELRNYVKAFRIIESQDEIVNRVVPNTSFTIAFRLKGQIAYLNGSQKIQLPSVSISGLRKSVRLIGYAKNSVALIVLFKETGVPAFFREPLHGLFEQSVSLNNIFQQSEISIVEERLSEGETDNARIKIVEEFLLSKLVCIKPDKLVEKAIADIYANKGIVKIKGLANNLYISQDAFEKRFRKVTGISPKQFSSIVRMKAVTQKTLPGSILDLALENGYYDQPHFNKDFKLFTGLSPREFYKSDRFW